MRPGSSLSNGQYATRAMVAAVDGAGNRAAGNGAPSQCPGVTCTAPSGQDGFEELGYVSREGRAPAALPAPKQGGNCPVDHVHTCSGDRRTATAARASAVALGGPGKARLIRERFPDLRHAPSRDPALSSSLLEDVGGETATNANPDGRDTKLPTEAIQLVLLDLPALKAATSLGRECTLVITAAGGTPFWVHPMPTLLSHVPEPSSPRRVARRRVPS